MPDASPIAGLVGTWRGSGRGEYPTMDDFDYQSEVSFVDVGVPTLVYRLRAWSPETGELLHLETGLWRSDPEGNLAVSIALPRVTELAEGQIVGGHIELTSRSVSRATGGAGLVA